MSAYSPKMTEPTITLPSSLDARFTIGRELGRGGMATVYLAEERKYGRQVAIKVMRAELAASVGGERFLREIGIVARLSHPHIVPLIDSGDAEGVLYYVSPYVAGGSLRDRLAREGHLPIAEATRIAYEVGTALDYAHRNGFVHRDVKPENILFADGQAVLADFGVARTCGISMVDAVTEQGMAVGTPAYMSPEQASGDSDIGTASDVYSLACVVYEMLAGTPPLMASTARALLMRQVTEMPRPIRAIRPEVSSNIEQALVRALAKAPADRFPSVSEFTAALQAADSGRAQILQTLTRSIAVLPFVNASPDPENEYLSDGITDELIDALSKVEGLRVASRTSVFALKGKLQDVRAIGALLGAAEVLEGTVRKSGDRLRITAQLTSTDDGRLMWSQRYDRTLRDVFEIQDEIARTIVGTLRATSFSTLTPIARRYTDNVTAYGLYLRGRYAWNKRSQEGVTEAIEYFEQAITEDPEYALAYTGLADAVALHVDYRSVPVHEGFERAKAYARKALALDDTLAEAHASLAWCLFAYDWDWENADAEFQRAIELDPRYATAHQWYGFLLASGGRLEEAIITGHTAQELDPSSVSVRRSLGWLYVYARRYEQARYHLTRAISMNPTAEESYRVLGLTLALEGQLDESERVLREAVNMHGAGSYTLATLGYSLARAGKRDAAMSIVKQLDEDRAREYVSPVALATVYIGLGDNTRALDWAEVAYEERRGWLAYFTVNPLLDPLRNEPRFKALVARVRR
jgi:serine/threonine protein kinase/Tfp pilus assembly protein PilF